MQVLEGSIREQRYNRRLECTHDAIYSGGELAYITDSMGYHKVGNPTTHQPAVTLHLYAPPIRECHVWCDDNNTSTQKPSTTPTLARACNHSEYGEVVVDNDNAT